MRRGANSQPSWPSGGGALDLRSDDALSSGAVRYQSPGSWQFYRRPPCLGSVVLRGVRFAERNEILEQRPTEKRLCPDPRGPPTKGRANLDLGPHMRVVEVQPCSDGSVIHVNRNCAGVCPTEGPRSQRLATVRDRDSGAAGWRKGGRYRKRWRSLPQAGRPQLSPCRRPGGSWRQYLGRNFRLGG